MKALLNRSYGPPETVLKQEEIPTPEPGENHVLVKVKYSAVNDWDWSMVTGNPKTYRLFMGLNKPKNPIPGMELSGIIESVGPNVSRFKPGDEVYGDTTGHNTFGTYAEYAAVHEEDLCLKPSSMSFQDAASISHASMLAYQALEDIAGIGNGESILINGGGGGVGTFGLQFAKLKNARVTGVDTGPKLKMMEELGFDQVLDYKKVDFTRQKEKWDLVLDCKSFKSPSDYKRSLGPKGRYVTVGGSMGNIIRIVLSGLFGGKKLYMLALKPNKDLDKINLLYEQGKIKTILDGPFEFSEAPKALQHFGEGKHEGKVLIAVNP